MTLTLAATWLPRGELPRLQRLHPRLRDLYAHVVIVAPVQADADAVRAAGELPGVTAVHSDDREAGRSKALELALGTDAATIHYCDLDRLIRWVELREDELCRTLDFIRGHDAVMLGRTPYAFATHPRALQDTERISNAVVSRLVGKPLDVSAGSKGFSRRAAEVLVRNAQPGVAMGTDSQWAVLLYRAGFDLVQHDVDGLDYETADRYLPHAADAETQKRVADEYDAQPEAWQFRVGLAYEIVRDAYAALTVELTR